MTAVARYISQNARLAVHISKVQLTNIVMRTYFIPIHWRDPLEKDMMYFSIP